MRGAERLVDVLERQAGCLGELLLRRLATELDLEPASGPGELLLALDDMHRDANRMTGIDHPAGNALSDPPSRIGREAKTKSVIELFHRPH